MVDIGPIHRTEYELAEDQSEAVCIAEAPGRIHYMGEHGEKNAGFFLSSAIDRTARVAVSGRKDHSIRFYAADLGERKRTTLVNLKFKREDRWANYIKLSIYMFAELGYPVRGFNFTISGNIPQQIGLASSAAIEIAAMMALKGFLKASIPEKGLAEKLAAAKTAFLGVETSPADYLVLLSAKRGYFLVVDEKSLGVELIKSPLTNYKTFLMDSRVPRLGVDGELKQRRKDTEKGLELLSRKKQGASFRDFVSDDLLNAMGALPGEIRRRSLHVVEEIRRIREASAALKQPDREELSKLIYHSHESLRDLYEVSCPEIDWLVKRSQEIEGILGSRMTGSGFGGCTYTILKESAVEEYRRRLEDYERIFGFHPLVHEVRMSAGAKIIQRA